MSDNWIVIAPREPDFLPLAQAEKEAREYYRSIAPNADEIAAKTFETIQLVDCGSNLERVRCPHCRADLDMEWWVDRMDEQFDEGFRFQDIALPCCGGVAQLPELEYEAPMAFSLWALSGRSPGIAEFSSEQLEHFRDILGVEVHQVRRHL